MNLDRSKYIVNGRLHLLQTPTYNAKSISSSIFELNYLKSDNFVAKSLYSSQKKGRQLRVCVFVCFKGRIELPLPDESNLYFKISLGY